MSLPQRRVQGLRSGALLRVTGGRPSAEEVAAVLLAIDLALAEEQRAALRPPRLSGWRLAARLEAVGGRRLGSLGELNGRGRS